MIIDDVPSSLAWSPNMFQSNKNIHGSIRGMLWPFADIFEGKLGGFSLEDLATVMSVTTLCG